MHRTVFPLEGPLILLTIGEVRQRHAARHGRLADDSGRCDGGQGAVSIRRAVRLLNPARRLAATPAGLNEDRLL